MDTTAAVAGGIAGLQYGLKGIPHRWRSMLRGEELVAPLLDRLLKPQP
ncbi:ADP-ribosylglycohydrolase family protein [Corallococcus soli]|nr:ADP-ribosylglycohydrolase family protein [Corallococcus soli]